MRQTGRQARSKEGYHWFRGWRKPTAAQRRVLDELVAGGTYAQIASRLGISEDGVKWHLGELRDEIGLSDRRELAEWWTEQRDQGSNLLLPFAGLWRLVANNAVASVAVTAVLAASIAVGWFAYRSLSGDDDATASSAVPLRTPEAAAVVPFVPTPTPTPSPRGALLFDVTTGEARILPGDYIDRRWLDPEVLTFVVYSQGNAAVIDAKGKVEVLSPRRNVSYYPMFEDGRVVLWGWSDGLVTAVDLQTGEEAQLGDFGSDPFGERREDVSALAGEVALSEEPFDGVSVYNLDGSDAQSLFSAAPGEAVSYISWSPGGEWLLIVLAIEEDGRVRERSVVLDANGSVVLDRDSAANWAGAGALRLHAINGSSLDADALVDVAHGAEIPVPDGTLLCLSPDSRYAVTAEPSTNTFNAPTEHRLHDLVTKEIIASVVVNGFLVNCDWTPDSSKVVLSPGGK
jgi:DNA-binding CsgD family transcriptional regulator